MKGRDHSEDLGIVGKIILEWILRKWVVVEGVDRMHLAQGRDQWWALVNTVMYLWVA
jgi:hypothetical protein